MVPGGCRKRQAKTGAMRPANFAMAWRNSTRQAAAHPYTSSMSVQNPDALPAAVPEVPIQAAAPTSSPLPNDIASMLRAHQCCLISRPERRASLYQSDQPQKVEAKKKRHAAQ